MEEELHRFDFFDPDDNTIPTFDDHMIELEEDHQIQESITLDSIKSQIASHPLYPSLLSSYIHSQKVGAPPETASLLEEINKESHVHTKATTTTTQFGADSQLDDFMRSYIEVLKMYTEELSKPFDEATSYLSSMESQLTDLCIQTLPSPTSVEEGSKSGGSDAELKETLMRKYSGYLSTLKEEFMKRRKKGKLPKDATSALTGVVERKQRMAVSHEDKKRLSEMTGLDSKQISNWFINQRKRHWRPSEEIKFALMEAGGSNHLDSS